MKRGVPPLVLFASLCGCVDRTVVTTSVALHVSIDDAVFNLSFVKAVDIYVTSADPARPINPAVTAPATLSANGLTFTVESRPFLPDAGSTNQIRLHIPGNPFVRNAQHVPGFDLLFQSTSAGTNPMKLVANVLGDTDVIATGAADRTIDDTPIVQVSGEKKIVELHLRCVPQFACDTGNHAPVVQPIADQTLAEGETRTIPVMASDPDGHALDYALTPAPSFATIDKATGQITLAPGFAGDSRTYSGVTVTVTDHGTPPLSTQVQFTIVVTNTNRPPHVQVVESSPVGSERCSTQNGALSCTLQEGESLELAVTASDDPEDQLQSLTLAAPTPAPTGSSLIVAPDNESAVFHWTTTFLPGGPTPIVLRFEA
jgi:hypothetical protein